MKFLDLLKYEEDLRLETKTVIILRWIALIGQLTTIYLKGISNSYTFAANFVKLQSAICKQMWKMDRKGGDALIIQRCQECANSKKNGKK